MVTNDVFIVEKTDQTVNGCIVSFGYIKNDVIYMLVQFVFRIPGMVFWLSVVAMVTANDRDKEDEYKRVINGKESSSFKHSANP